MTDTEFRHRLEQIVGDITLSENHAIVIGRDAAIPDGRYYFQIKCWRKDAVTGEMGFGFGGKAYLTPHATDSELVQTVFGLYKGYWEHEARETFEWRGRRVFGPHISTEALWEIARRVDVRSAKHVEDKPEAEPETQPVDWRSSMPPHMRVEAMKAGWDLRDVLGRPLTKNSRGEWINEAGDTPCPNDGEMVNKRCWQCGWVRSEVVVPTEQDGGSNV